ncbi:MAG: LysR family transcriptional regulator [Proteobacteria bacterium]|nr:MAG: LysR family transcriptional regulator [Pseudomonadota bacterium]
MELSDLKLLQDLVLDPHLSRVAQRLHLTQPALSKRLRAIEEELGLNLFERRGPRGLEPTPAAREIAGLSERLLLGWNSGLSRVLKHQDEPLHFGIVGPQIFMREIVLPWWSKRTAKYSDLTFEAHISPLSKVSFELVQAGMDVGILEHREELADFICKPVYAETWGVVAHADADVNLDDPLKLARLHWGALSVQNNPVDEWLVRRQRMVPPTYRMIWNDLTAIAQWVADTKNSATVLPRHACRSLLEQKRLKFTSLGRDSKRALYLAYRRKNPHQKLIQELLGIGGEN